MIASDLVIDRSVNNRSLHGSQKNGEGKRDRRNRRSGGKQRAYIVLLSQQSVLPPQAARLCPCVRDYHDTHRHTHHQRVLHSFLCFPRRENFVCLARLSNNTRALPWAVAHLFRFVVRDRVIKAGQSSSSSLQCADGRARGLGQLKCERGQRLSLMSRNAGSVRC